MADTIVADLVARLRADTTDFTKGFDDAEKHSRSFAQRMGDVGKSMMSTGLKMTAGITAPLAIVGKLAFDAASDLNESLSKVDVVFGDSAKNIVKWSETAATSFGMSQQQALEAAGTFGNLFVALGITGDVAANTSKELVYLAADLASFNNANIDEVLVALRSGLLGEAEPLRKFGVSLSAARIESEALAMGLVKASGNLGDIAAAQIKAEKATIAFGKATKAYGAESVQARDAAAALANAEEDLGKALHGSVPELTAAQKAQAAYSVIMKDTAVAQGDFQRTASGAANQQRIMAARFKDMQAQLGQTLIPIFQQVAGVVMKIADAFQNLDPKWQKMVVYAGLALAAVGPLVTAFGALATIAAAVASPITLVVIAIAAVGAAMVLMWLKWDEIWNWMKEHPAILLVVSILAAPVAALFLIIGAIKFLYENWGTIWPRIQAIAEGVWSVIGPILRAIDSVLGEIAGAAVWMAAVAEGEFNRFAGAVQGMWNAVDGPLNWIYNRLEDIASAARAVANALDKLPDTSPGGTGFFGPVGDLFQASGGPVTGGSPYIVGEQGPELFVPGMSGSIIPNHALSGSGGGGGAGTLVIQLVQGGRATAEVVVAELNRAGGPKISQRAIA